MNENSQHTRFGKYQGQLTVKQFDTVMREYNFAHETKQALKKFLVHGYSYASTEKSRQFIYKKLVRIEPTLEITACLTQ